MRALQVVLTSVLLGLGFINTAAAETKLTVGVALPRAQLGQPNGASADVAEPVRQALMSYLKGPVIEVIALEARIPMQIAAEAKKRVARSCSTRMSRRPRRAAVSRCSRSSRPWPACCRCSPAVAWVTWARKWLRRR